MMENIWNKINIYPHPISLTHNKNNLFYSIYGLILSILSYVVIISLFYHYTYDLFNLTNPIIKTSQSQINETLKIEADKIFKYGELHLEVDFNSFDDSFDKDYLLKSAFSFCLSKYDQIGDKYDIYCKNEGFYKQLKISDSINNQYKYKYSIKFEIDDKTDFIHYHLKNDSEIDSNSTMKLKDIEIILKHSDVRIYFEFNKPVEIKNFSISSVHFFTEVYDNTIDTENYDNFSSEYIKYFNLYLDEYVSLKYRMIKFNTDSNPFYSRIDTEYIPQIDFFFKYNNYYYSSPEKNYELLMIIQFREIIDVYIRIYKKVLDVLSELGGIFNPLIILGKLLVLNFNEKKFKIDILNHLFTDEDISRNINKRSTFLENNLFSEKKISFIQNISSDNKLKLEAKGDFSKNKTCCFSGKTENFNSIEMNELSCTKSEKIKDEIERSFIKKNEFFAYGSGFNYIQQNSNQSNLKNKIGMFHKMHRRSPKLIFNKNEIIDIPGKESNLNQKDNSFISFSNFKFKKKAYIKEKNTLNQIDSYLKIKKEKNHKLLRYSFVDILKSVICWRKMLNNDLLRKENIFHKIRNKLNLYFEITNIIRLYENLEKIKFIIFNTHQMDCFKYMIHDINFNNQKKEQKSLIDLTKYFQKNNKNFIERYFDESIKMIMKNDIKKIIIKE